MVVKGKNRLNEKGQAAIETAFALPFLIWLLYYTLNAYHSLHTGHIAQKYAVMNLYQRLDNRAKFAVDQNANALIRRNYMAVQYTTDQGNLPRRRILLEGSAGLQIDGKVGICKELAGACRPR